MSICPNLARTVAIEVRFSINLAVVFDFIYFRFRPSKAKWIGNVLPNRQNAENYLQRFFFFELILFAAVIKKLKSALHVFGPILLQTTYIAGTIGTVPSFGPLCLSTGRWIAASILKTQCYCRRHYIDATMPLIEQQYCSVFNFQLVFRGLFLQFAEHCLRTQTDSLRQ